MSHPGITEPASPERPALEPLEYPAPAGYRSFAIATENDELLVQVTLRKDLLNRAIPELFDLALQLYREATPTRPHLTLVSGANGDPHEVPRTSL